MDSVSRPSSAIPDLAGEPTEPVRSLGGVLDMNALRCEEQKFVTRLAAEPMDMDARADLAWCLLLQALHQAGREAGAELRGGRATVQDSAAGQAGGKESLLNIDRCAEAILRECARHRFVVNRLCRDGKILAQVEMMGLLLKRFGAEPLLEDLESESDGLLRELCTDLKRGAESGPPQPRFRRLTGH